MTYQVTFHKGDRAIIIFSNEDHATDSQGPSGEVRWVEINGDKHYMPPQFAYTVKKINATPAFVRGQIVALKAGSKVISSSSMQEVTIEVDQLLAIGDMWYSGGTNKFSYTLLDCKVPDLKFNVTVEVGEEQILNPL